MASHHFLVRINVATFLTFKANTLKMAKVVFRRISATDNDMTDNEIVKIFDNGYQIFLNQKDVRYLIIVRKDGR